MKTHFESNRLRAGFACLLASAVVLSGALTAHGQSGSQGKPPAANATADNVALDGYCPVCIIKLQQWVKGRPDFASTYDGKTYYFPDAQVKATFDADPAKFVPALGGDCTVCLKELNKRVAGKIQHASLVNERLFLFPSDDVKQKFDANPTAYTDVDLALDGQCSVCRVELQQEVPGSTEHTVFHDGMRYLFPSEKQVAMFVSNPGKYTGASAGSGIGAYLEITLKIDPANRNSAAGVYKKYKEPFLSQVAGAKSKTLLIRDEDVQVLHGFATVEQAKAYLSTSLFSADIVTELKPFLAAGPEVRIYTAVE